MIKVAAPAIKNPERRTMAEFHNYWAESHGISARSAASSSAA